MASRARRNQPPETVVQASARPVSEVELEAFYRSVFLPLVRRATWKHGVSKEDASDLVQDAFVLALRKLDLQKNPKAWLNQVVDHLAINFQRKTARRAQLVSRWGQSSSLASADSDSVLGRPEVND